MTVVVLPLMSRECCMGIFLFYYCTVRADAGDKNGGKGFMAATKEKSHRKDAWSEMGGGFRVLMPIR